MLRIVLLVATNFAIMLVAGIMFQVLGIEKMLAANGMNVELYAMLFMCFALGMGGSAVSLLLSKWIAKRAMRVQIIDQPGSARERWLLKETEKLARKAGIGKPEVGIFPSQISNAFATGWNRNNALVAVSDGLLERFSEAEARAVLAHEIGHIANGDMITPQPYSRHFELAGILFLARYRHYDRPRCL